MESRTKGFVLTAMIVAAIGASLLVMLAVLNRRDSTVSLNHEIQYDDFAFSVLSVRRAAAVDGANGMVKPSGLFYIVALKVANHAVRVDYKYKRSCALLVDEWGKEYPPSPEGQLAHESIMTPLELCSAPIPPGSSCVTEVVFDVPAGVNVSQLRITFGPIADIFDPIFSGRKRIALAPVTPPAGHQER